jgi:hypothetical protein
MTIDAAKVRHVREQSQCIQRLLMEALVCYAILVMYFWLPPRGNTSATLG